MKIKGFDFGLSLKACVAETKGSVNIEKQPNTLYQDLTRVIDEIDSNHKIGTFDDLDNVDFPWIRMTGDFLLKGMTVGHTSSPHFRWLCLKEWGYEKRIIYLVGSLAYQVPRTSKWDEPAYLTHHVVDCLDDLQAQNWEDAAWNLVQEVNHYAGKVGIESKIETVVEVLHRSNLVERHERAYSEKDDGPSQCRVTFGTPLYVASIV